MIYVGVKFQGVVKLSAQVIPGATAVGLVFRDGVILAAEKRMTYGRFIAAKTVKKVFKITDRIGAACAGLMADMQEIIRIIRYIVKLKELQYGVSPSVNSVAKLTSVLLFQNRLYPLITQIIIGGYIDSPKIFSLDPLGSLIEEKYVAVGTGGEIAMGLLEAEYSENLNKSEARDLVLKCIKSAIGRDAISGDGIDYLIFTRNSVEEESVIFK